jgi:hypothetical protein
VSPTAAANNSSIAALSSNFAGRIAAGATPRVYWLLALSWIGYRPDREKSGRFTNQPLVAFAIDLGRLSGG